MIRPAVAADIPAIVALGRAMVAEVPNYRGQPYDADGVGDLAAHLVAVGGLYLATNDHGTVIGMMAAVIVPHFATGQLLGVELVIYVQPSDRGGRTVCRLVRALESWARERGAARFRLVPESGYRTDGLETMFRRLDYTPVGLVMEKTL